MFKIIDLYITKNFLHTFLYLSALICSIIYIFDTIELLRISSSKNIAFSTLLLMGILKLPMHLQKIFAFLILISSLTTFVKMNKSNELAILKVSGYSIWRIMRAPIIASFVLGILCMTLLNPLSSWTFHKYQKLEAINFKGIKSNIALGQNGLWIKQAHNGKTDSIVHALRISIDLKQLFDVTFYFFDDNNKFLYRLDTDIASLKDHSWHIEKAEKISDQLPSEHIENLTIKTNLSFEQIQESLIPPETISFWELPHFINIAQNSGLSAVKHILYLYKLIALPFLCIATMLLGISFSEHSSRFSQLHKQIPACLFIGFIMYFISDFMFALAVSGKINCIASVIAPIAIILAIAIYILLHNEEIKA